MRYLYALALFTLAGCVSWEEQQAQRITQMYLQAAQADNECRQKAQTPSDDRACATASRHIDAANARAAAATDHAGLPLIFVMP